ncbi:MAG TPA: BatA domain-containing protein [Phycisphaerae bacterium]|nr:BatA domain-containing protein [Phycisphaerae bacterium]
MLAVTFLFPTILGAAAAAAAPVIIHLILRTKPRKIVFPAMRFVRKSHRANLSKLRLKHLILLLMRMLAIALLALLIARAQLPRWTSVADTSVPAAAVVIVDNSGSMRYVHRGKTLLAWGKPFAGKVIDSLPAGSRVAILPTETAPEKLSFQADRKFIGEQLAGVQATYGTRPIGPALTRALAMLEKIDMPRKEVYIVSDMTARSWRDLEAVRAKGVSFVVLNCGSGEDANISLGELRLSESSVPQGAEVSIETLVRSAQVGGEVAVRAELNGKPVDSQSVPLQPGAAAAATLTFSPREAGLAHGRVLFQQGDPLAMDNVRYFTFHVGPPVRALVVRDGATVGRGDRTSFLMGHALVPAGSGAPKGAWISRETITADRLDGTRLGGKRMVVLANVSSLSEAQWKDLAKFVRGGGHVWVVIGSLVSASSYNSAAAQRILPAAFGELEVLPKRLGWRNAPRGEAMLAPFAREANPPLSEVRCQRRFRLASVVADGHVILRYADDKPAILTRDVGEGSVVLWNFSPVRGFSNLVSLAQFPILVQRTARLLATRSRAQMMYLWGQTASVPIPRSMQNAMMTVRKPDSPAEEPVVRALDQRALSLQADRLGHWNVQFSEASTRLRAGFSVNASFAESDLGPQDVEALRAVFPPDQFVVASDMADLTERRRTVTQALDLAAPLLVLLLLLMTGESFFANRFYRQDQTSREPA